MPEPKGCVTSEQRICFGLKWFDKEEDANAYAKQVREAGITLNGGFYHGMPCGRAPVYDYVADHGGKLYAVTD